MKLSRETNKIPASQPLALNSYLCAFLLGLLQFVHFNLLGFCWERTEVTRSTRNSKELPLSHTLPFISNQKFQTIQTTIELPIAFFKKHYCSKINDFRWKHCRTKLSACQTDEGSSNIHAHPTRMTELKSSMWCFSFMKVKAAMQFVNYKTQRAKLGQEREISWNYLVPHNMNPLTSHEDQTYPKDEKIKSH